MTGISEDPFTFPSLNEMRMHAGWRSFQLASRCGLLLSIIREEGNAMRSSADLGFEFRDASLVTAHH